MCAAIGACTEAFQEWARLLGMSACCQSHQAFMGKTQLWRTQLWRPGCHTRDGHLIVSAPCSLQHNITCSCLSHTTSPVAPRIRGGHCPPCGSLQPPAEQHMPAFLTCGILDLGKGLPIMLHLVHTGVGGSLLLGNGALPSLQDSPAVRATAGVLKVRGCHRLSMQAALHKLLAHDSCIHAHTFVELQTLL